MEIAKKMRKKKKTITIHVTVETGVVEKGNRISRSRSHSQGVVEKWDKGKEDQDLGHIVQTGVEQKCEKWNEDQDRGHTVQTVVEHKSETWNEDQN
jgi:flagellar biosynthesis chaperone FliJ